MVVNEDDDELSTPGDLVEVYIDAEEGVGQAGIGCSFALLRRRRRSSKLMGYRQEFYFELCCQLSSLLVATAVRVDGY